MSVSAEYLRSLLSYDPDTGIFRWLKASNNRISVGGIAGTTNSRGYRMIRIDGKGHLAHRLAWLHVYGIFPKEEIDHIDSDVANNRLDNLREASRVQNMGNTRGMRDLPKGVLFRKRCPLRPYEAVLAGKYLGNYHTVEAAAAAYKRAAIEKFGEFARAA